MNEYIFFSPEGFAQDPNGNDVENCQLMGIAYGVDKVDAVHNLLAENKWIEDHRFTPEEFFIKELTPCNNAKAIITYLTELLTEKQLEKYQEWLESYSNK